MNKDNILNDIKRLEENNYPDMGYWNHAAKELLRLLLDLIEYYEEENISFSPNTRDIKKIFMLQSLSLKDNRLKPTKKKIKLNNLQDYSDFWIKDSKLRLRILAMFSLKMFKNKLEKGEEIGIQKTIANFNEVPFVEELLIENRKINESSIRNLDYIIANISKDIF